MKSITLAGRITLALILTVFLACPPPWAGASGVDRLRVRIFSTLALSSLSARSPGLTAASQGQQVECDSLRLSPVAGTGKILILGRGTRILLDSPISLKSSSPIILQAKGAGEKALPSPIQVRGTGKELIVTVTPSVEEYTAGVVKGEMPDAPPEALKAQAVACRSYTLANLGRHAKEGFDFCDSTHCQHYAGLAPPGSPWHRAAAGTGGITLSIKGRPIPGYYHSACGGRTSSPGDVFGGENAGMKGISCTGPDGHPLCKASPFFRWRFAINRQDLSAILQKEPLYRAVCPLISIRITKTDPAGRVMELLLTGNGRKMRASGYDFWQAVASHAGWGRFPSSCFTVTGKEGNFIFQGRGLGHGAGMCQHGAMELARQGQNFKQILNHYFPGT